MIRLQWQISLNFEFGDIGSVIWQLCVTTFDIKKGDLPWTIYRAIHRDLKRENTESVTQNREIRLQVSDKHLFNTQIKSRVYKSSVNLSADTLNIYKSDLRVFVML